jgi:hypothetical protein
MNRIIIIAKLGIAILPFYVFNYVLHMIFHHIPRWVTIPVNIILVIAAIYFINSGRKQFIIDNEDEEGMPVYLEKSSYFFIVLGGVIAFFLGSADFRTTLYIDNGRAVPVEIKISSDQTETVPANGFIQTSAPIGINEILIDGKKKTFDIKERGEWVYNIDNINSYIAAPVRYSNPDVMYKENSGETKKPADTLKTSDIIHKEFFKLETTYIFEAPESITISKEAQSDKVETRTVLYRLPKGISQLK